MIIATNISLSLISDMIGKDIKNSAFVYGIYNLFEKFANGVVLYIIIKFYTTEESDLRNVISICPIVFTILSLLLTGIGEKKINAKKAEIKNKMNERIG